MSRRVSTSVICVSAGSGDCASELRGRCAEREIPTAGTQSVPGREL